MRRFTHPRSRHRLLTVLAALFVATAVATAANPFTAAPDDALFSTVRNLALAAGQAPPAPVSPMSYAELDLVLRGIDVDRLPPALIEQYRAARAHVANGQSNGSAADTRAAGTIGLTATAEAYLHTSDDADEWRYWYPDRRPMISIPFRISPFPGFAISADLDWRRNYPILPGYETINADPRFNVLSDLLETDVQFPFHALVAAAGSRWSVQLGRSRIGWGLSHTGSLLLSDHVDYHDFAMASVFGNIATYRALYLDLEPWVTGAAPDPDRAYLAHRIELRPWRWLSLAANEAMVFHDTVMELRYLNPLMILHSWFIPNYGNSMINLEAAARPVSGLEVWAHLAIDQVQSAIEEERGYADGEPEALGYLAGAEYVLPLTGRDATWLTLGTEWVYTDPWMYIGRDLLGSFSYRRRVQAEHVPPAGAKVIVEKSLGYPAGPDFYGITGYGRLGIDGRWTVSAEGGFYAHGENTIARVLPADDQADATRETPSGDAPEFVLAVRLGADGRLWEATVRGVLLRVDGGFVLDVVRVLNNDAVAGEVFRDLQFSPYLSFSTVILR